MAKAVPASLLEAKLGPVCPQGSGDGAKAVATGEVEDVACGLVITSIGYKSLPIDPVVPFDSRKAIIPNSMGRVQQAAGTLTPPVSLTWLSQV